MTWKRVLGFLLARPLIAIAIAAVVVVVMLQLNSHRETTPVTHRTEHVGLTEAQQTQLGNQQYAKTLRQDRAAIVSSGAASFPVSGRMPVKTTILPPGRQ